MAFCSVEIESAMKIAFGSVAVDDGRGDNVGVVGVGAADGYALSEKVNVSVARSRVCAGLNFHNVTVIGMVNRCLYVVKIGGTVIVNGDYSRLARHNSQQPNQCDNCLFHVLPSTPQSQL
jgi:hypothetical protein